MMVWITVRPSRRRLPPNPGGGASAYTCGVVMAAAERSHGQPSQPLAADGGALNRVLKHTHLSKESVLRVTGSAGPTAAIWLNRHGYENAAYVHPNWVGAQGFADALLIPHACATAELAQLLRSGDCVRDGGLLIVQAAPDRFGQGVDSLADTLRPLGYQIENQLCDGGRDVYIARRHCSGGFKKAA
jgi:hypothetical protein